jgi:opacity protein-like surface antigen
LVSAGIGIFSGSLDDENFGNDSSTNTTSAFSYNVGAGFRWDISKNFFMKATYRLIWADLFENSEDALMFNGVMVNLGYMF